MAKPSRGITTIGTDADETFVGTVGDDIIYGEGGNDSIDGGAGNDDLRGHLGDDVIHGGTGSDTIFGHEGNDFLYGGDGNDSLYGNEGNDLFDGGGGSDTLGAGPGDDRLTGGSGADRFYFVENFADSGGVVPGTNVHTITDYSRADGDYIDLHLIDADGNRANDTRKGNTDFKVVGTPSGAAGEAWMQPIYDPVTGVQTGVSIYLNYDSDAEADTRIDVLGVTSLTWSADIIG